MTASAPPGDIAGDHLRGSALLLLGRLAGLVVALATQVLLVRALDRTEFGRLSFALAAVVVLQAALSFGLDRADTRFLARYELDGDVPRLAGTLVVEAAVVVVSVLLAAVTALLATAGALDGLLDRRLAAVLALAVFLVPLQLLDVFVVNALAVFARPWDVFVRRYVLEPGLRLGVAVAVALTGGGAVAVVVGFLLGGALATAVYVVLLGRVLRHRELLPRGSARSVRPPWRPVLAFCAPLVIANVTAVAATDFAAVVLAHYRPAPEVAALRAVQPFAALGVVVLFTFGTLFTPAAARLHGLGDLPGLRALHWRTTLWVAVLSWPVFALTTVFARPLVTALLGARYAGSSGVLALLAAAAYANAACGPNGATVQILGRVRWMLATNVVGLLVLVASTLLLVPDHGATGAAVAVLVTAGFVNVCKQVGLHGDVGVLSRPFVAVAARVAVATGLCAAAAAVGPDSLAFAVVVVGAIGALLLWASRADLDVTGTFPAVRRIPLLRRLAG